ncbi:MULTISPECIES: tetratricopeptide repeat protein [unclassified Pseudomonas]|uniref:tetratricopeptide repeat protein n=1 Tax=unclassified Pseudomonas TaxID=196821 RepID=UPI000A1E1F40|nr:MULTISPECIES: tetratricopeptide repeat protein [unclassified Pseudomonas]
MNRSFKAFSVAGSALFTLFVSSSLWAQEPRELYDAMKKGECLPHSERLHEQAVTGDLNAQLEFGKAIQEDLCEVVERWSPGMPEQWFRKPAEQGIAEAQVELGRELSSDWSVEGEDAAVVWYLKAAEQGNAKAQFNLAQIYHRGGRSIKNLKDMDKALAYYHQAAESGYPSAYMLLGAIYQSGTEVPQDDVVAAKWLRKYAETGNDSGQFDFAEVMAAGRGIEKDEAGAFEWYGKSAAQGNEYAQYEMARMLEQGTGTKRNEREAAKLYRKLADANFGKAQLALGSMYAQGRGGLPKSKSKAKFWMLKAYERSAPGAEEALDNL